MIQMGKNTNGAKIVLCICSVVAVFLVFLYYINNKLGAWWQAVYDFGVIHNEGYINAFGIPSKDNNLLFLGALGVIAGVLFFCGALALLFAVYKEEKRYANLTSLMMLGGVFLFCAALLVVDRSEFGEAIFGGGSLGFILEGDKSLIIFLGQYADYSWGLGIGFIIALIVSLVALLASFFLD